ncbi:MAG TPA: diadenylate cyclase CdaA [Geobacteraceae bacterium]|nr:diadenylate cyclase CdaA [Geobacteraceae bacterium]
MADLMQKSGWLIPLLDILLVATIIYRLLTLVRESTAIRILVVLQLLLVGCLVAQFVGLVTTAWLLYSVLGSLLIVLVVIFQYDIRRAMLTISRSRIARSDDSDHGESESGEVLEQLADSAVSLSERRIGALIVIERDMSLDQFMEVGTDIDAKVTSELLSSIFLPYSPIHDGAVIIQRGKLTKAGCFLPLTQNPDVAKELGTRHRAAIGLTELSDAIVIVVSEETGSVSVVSGGRITSGLDSAHLRKLLRRMVESRWLQ